MIEFVTLFLGLAAGPQAVEVTASAEVEEVRLLLDGEIVATDTEAPWSLTADLGTSLKPRLLEAVALDGDGAELGRAFQRLNVPRPPAEARFGLERGADGRVSEAHLAWESRVRSKPRETRVWFDQERLEVTNPERFPIPPYDRTTCHLLQAELTFSTDVAAQAHAVFGGVYVDESQTELTAVPVSVKKRARNARPEAMNAWFRTTAPTRVVAFEKGGLDLVLVRGPGVSQAIEALEGTLGQGLSTGGISSASTPGGEGGADLGNLGNMGVVSSTERLQRIMALEGDQRLRILVPQARVRRGTSVEMEVFALSPEITSRHGGLYWALGQDVQLPGLSPELRLADAVAVAGLQAANGNRRRAVLLVLAEEGEDASRHDVRAVREYLAALRVPLVVWRIGAEAGRWSDWGPGEEVPHFRALQGAARRLSAALDEQRIVWLEGLHLPNAVEITQEARKFVADASAPM